MNIWNKVPFLRLLLPFMAGILIAIYYPYQIDYFNILLTIIFSAIIAFTFIKKLNVSYRNSPIFGVTTILFLLLSGYQITILNTDKFKPNHFSNYSGADLFLAKTNSTILEKEHSFKVPVRIIAIRQNNKWISTSGNAMCYFKKDSLSEQIRYGYCIVLKTHFSEIKPPGNPYEFNYKKYLYYHNIYHQAYLNSGDWASTGINKGNKLISLCISARAKLLDIYKANQITGDEYAVGSALVLGYTDKLDQDLISAYANSGTLHVLSVSGLHVGIIYLLFNYAFFFFNKFKSGAWIKMFLLLMILWFYALLTGFSPAVLRSTIMFSIIAIAESRKFNSNIYNTLAVSCFMLLIANPYIIMDVGFQLSYLAVLGIVIIHPWIYDKWKPTTWIMDQIWIILSVSIAAQMATFPLSLYYFHQFPNYFLLSNLLVIPISTIILGYGLLLFILGKISAIGITCGKIFSGLVWSLNESVKTIDKIPGAITPGISITPYEACLIYAFIILTIVFLYKKQVRYLFPTFSVIIVLLLTRSMEVYYSQHQKTFIIYDIEKESAYDFLNGEETILLADSSLLIHKQNKLTYHVQQNWWKRNIRKHTPFTIETHNSFHNSYINIANNYIQFHHKRIAIITSKLNRNIISKQKLSLDFIILSKNAGVTIADLQKLYSFKTIIFDSSNSGKQIERWRRESDIMHINYYSVPDQGAFIEEIES